MLKKQIANFVTLLNAVSGFLAIISLFLNLNFLFYLFIFGAMIFDGLDGFLARKLKITTKRGIQLDSLADTVSFVLAPALFVFIEFFNKDLIGLIPSILIISFGLYRLAVFNISEEKRYFVGLTTPAFTFIIIVISFFQINKYILFILVILLSYLMVSNKIKLPKPKL